MCSSDLHICNPIMAKSGHIIAEGHGNRIRLPVTAMIWKRGVAYEMVRMVGIVVFCRTYLQSDFERSQK